MDKDTWIDRKDIPTKEGFYSNLNMEHITNEDYELVKKSM